MGLHSVTKAVTVWLTGLPCSGKTTLANALFQWAIRRGKEAQKLDGDELRSRCRTLGFSREDRIRHILQVGRMCSELCQSNVIAIAALVSPYRDVRERVRRMMRGRFVEVFVDCPLEVCIERDVKGMYSEALAGRRPGFTGIDAPYEAPLKPAIRLNTAAEDVNTSAKRLIAKVARILEGDNTCPG